MILLLTGPVGVGKTTACVKAVERFRSRGIECRGVLAPALRDCSGVKIGIQLLDLTTEERRVLARHDVELQGPRKGQYSFERATLDWGIEAVRKALRTSGGLVFVDEIGPLELIDSQGLCPVLCDLAGLPHESHALVVVRRRTLGLLRDRLRGQHLLVLGVSIGNRERVPVKIMGAFTSSSAGPAWRTVIARGVLDSDDTMAQEDQKVR